MSKQKTITEDKARQTLVRRRSKTVTMRMTQETYDAITLAAKQDMRTRSGEIEYILAEWLQRNPREV